MAQVLRPDRTARTFWRTAVDEPVLDDPGLEVLLPEAAALSDLAPDLLQYQQLPGLWPAEEITVRDVYDYFAGGHTVSLPREGYEETLAVPQCDPAKVEEAVAQAVEQGLVWLASGPASILGEPLPAGVFSAAALLRPPPGRIEVGELMETSIPGAWKEGKTNVLAIAAALSNRRGVNLPWSTVRSAIEDGIRARWIELSRDSARVALRNHRRPKGDHPGPPPQCAKRPPCPGRRDCLPLKQTWRPTLSRTSPTRFRKSPRAAVGNDLRFNLRVEFGGATAPDPAAVEKINQLLSEVSGDLRLD